ncbi:hypothetical protein DLE60_18685 [Micromonospora globispora]|uniref:MFS transporter n=1 Tax=Micromonospora globispora TaxID=1450148 RepID=UPI000D6EF15B|nr:MFS transporter [Micromonospora globispora]PWU59019.1 hypothetical protein DLE60_18685 [Micromonospora globispora]
MDDAEVPDVRRSLGQAVAALGVPAYRWWFVSQILSYSGVMTQMVAQSWLVLQLTALPGALLAAAGPAWPGGRRIRLLALLAGAAVVLTAVSPHVVTAFIGLAATGFLSIWLIASANTLVQLRADQALRGRVMAVWFMALPGTMPFTGFLSGLVAQAAGARAGFALAGAALLVTVFLTWRSLDR